MNSNKFYIEDAHSVGLDALELIEITLKDKFGIILTSEEEDSIYIPIEEALEKLSNGEYRSHL